jgi:hypothetical protein
MRIAECSNCGAAAHWERRGRRSRNRLPYDNVRELMNRGHHVRFDLGGYGGHQAIMRDWRLLRGFGEPERSVRLDFSYELQVAGWNFAACSVVIAVSGPSDFKVE